MLFGGDTVANFEIIANEILTKYNILNKDGFLNV